MSSNTEIKQPIKSRIIDSSHSRENAEIKQHNDGYNHGYMIGSSHGRRNAIANYTESYESPFNIRKVGDPYEVGAAIGYNKGYQDAYWTTFNKMYPILTAGSMWKKDKDGK
jgi:hypothetical protein